MKIFITLDYEPFLMEPGNDIENSLINPTNRLLDILDTKNIKAVFFVDAGFLLAMEKQKKKFPRMEQDQRMVINQIRKLEADGHEIGLHIHPHWEDCSFDGRKWNIVLHRFKLADFKKNEAEAIFDNYTHFLNSLIQHPVRCYRAGGWCLQPFAFIRDRMQQHSIYIESTVVPGAYYQSETHYYDFRNHPAKDVWRFSTDPAQEDINGYFVEVPLSSHQLHPSVYWKVLFRNLFSKTKGNDNGKPIRPSAKEAFKKLFFKTTDAISIDSYKSDNLIKSFVQKEKNSGKYFCIIGHPKCFTEHTYKNLYRFIRYAVTQQHLFATFSAGLEEGTAFIQHQRTASI